MSKVEFLSVFIGIIFGLAVVDLVQKWRGLRESYWEYSLWSLGLFLVSLVNWYNLYDRIEIVVVSFANFVLVLTVPLTFYVAVMIFTPEKEDKDTKAYFFDKRKLFFGLLFIFLILNWIIMFLTDDFQQFWWLNYLTAVMIGVNIIMDKVWLRTVALAYIFGLFVLNLVLV